jgi:arylsulfatase A-like enzyme
MLIGKYAGETQRGYSHFNRFGKDEVFLAERLAREKVRTISVQGHWYFFQNYGMERGFDVVNTSAAPKAFQAAEGDKSSTSDSLSNAVILELEKPELATQPFFLWAHYTDPHAEYIAHDGIDFGNDSRARYDGEVAFVDREIGRVFDKLQSLPFSDRTSVIVTSDHGEAFREHGMIRHGFELWEELVRVPLLVRVPGLAPRRITARRSLIDIVPTVLDLMRVPLPSAESRDFLSGESLVPDLALPEGAPIPERPVFVDMAEGPYNAERHAFIEGEEKLVLSNGRVLSLFDLAADPGEKQDLSADRARSARAVERYRAFRETLREVRVPRR